jgi:RecA-family ATPase
MDYQRRGHGPADTIKPRLRKLGADMEMIAIPKRELNFTPNQITPQIIDTFLFQFPAALLVIDPIIAYAGKRNTDKAGDVRGLLTSLALVAEKRKTAIILIRHLNKSIQSKALYRGQGSIDFAAACRSAFVFTEDGGNRERRLMAHTKGSVAGFQPTIEFFIDDQGAFRWGQQTADTADEALGTGEPKRDREARERDAAQDFLTKLLSVAPMPSNTVKAKAQEAGISNGTLWRAKEVVGVRASKERGTGEWWWRLP